MTKFLENPVMFDIGLCFFVAGSISGSLAHHQKKPLGGLGERVPDGRVDSIR